MLRMTIHSGSIAASADREPAPPAQGGSSADVGASRESVALPNSKEAHKLLRAALTEPGTRNLGRLPASLSCANVSESAQ